MKKSRRLTPEQKHIFRDACIFAVKLWLDGLKDFVLAIAGLAAAAVDLIRGKSAQGYLFYKVMDIGHRLDTAIDVYGGHHPPEDQIEPPDEPFR